MAAAQRRLEKIVDAVAWIIGDDHKAKKLRKSKALKRFIGKLEETKRDKQEQLASKKIKKKEATDLSRQVAELTKQIKKANKVLEGLS